MGCPPESMEREVSLEIQKQRQRTAWSERHACTDLLRIYQSVYCISSFMLMLMLVPFQCFSCYLRQNSTFP